MSSLSESILRGQVCRLLKENKQLQSDKFDFEQSYKLVCKWNLEMHDTIVAKDEEILRLTNRLKNLDDNFTHELERVIEDRDGLKKQLDSLSVLNVGLAADVNFYKNQVVALIDRNVALHQQIDRGCPSCGCGKKRGNDSGF